MASLNKKTNIAIVISVTAFFISTFSLILVCVNHQESKKIDFKWEANSDNGVLVKMERGLIDNEGKTEEIFNLPLWIEFKVTNTGLRTFSVDSIWLTDIGKKEGQHTLMRLILKLTTVDSKPHNINEHIVSNEISFPLVVDPGHSKKFYKKINIPISNRLYDGYSKHFKEKAFSIGDIYRLNDDETRISSYFKINAEIVLAGGEKKNTFVDIDGGGSE